MLAHPLAQYIVTPYVWIFIVCWLLLNLVDALNGFRPMAPSLYSILRLVIILVSLILVVI